MLLILEISRLSWTVEHHIEKTVQLYPCKEGVMGRTPDPRRKEELINNSVAYVLSHGVATLSLRPLAASLNTSARNLLYHFETSSRLLELIMDEIRFREIESLRTELKNSRTEVEIEDAIYKHLESFTTTMRAYIEYSFSISFENAHRRSYLSEVISKWKEALTELESICHVTPSFIDKELTNTFGSVLLRLAEIS